jgi:hypothetical protein
VGSDGVAALVFMVHDRGVVCVIEDGRFGSLFIQPRKPVSALNYHPGRFNKRAEPVQSEFRGCKATQGSSTLD